MCPSVVTRLELAEVTEAIAVVFWVTVRVITSAADFDRVEPTIVRGPSELRSPAILAEVSVLSVDDAAGSAGSAAEAHVDDGAAASLGEIAAAAVSQSAVFIFAVEAISEAVAELVLENRSEHVHVIAVKTHRSGLKWMRVLLCVAVEQVALLGVGGC